MGNDIETKANLPGFNGHPQLDVGSAKRVIICGFLLV